jgi:hypothetical protein
MKRSTPVIMGILLILGVAALGYLDQFHNQTKNSSSNHSFIGENTLKGNLKSLPSNSTPLKKQQSTSFNVSTNKTVQNSTNNAQNQNSTSLNPSGS